jgi:hypothetical protein
MIRIQIVSSAMIFLTLARARIAVSLGSSGRIRQTWSLDQYCKETVHEEIKAIMEQSLADAGSKTFIKGTQNSIVGWRQKQVSCVL